MVQEIHTETSILRTLKIMPRNLNEIVRSWIRLQYSMTVEKKEKGDFPALRNVVECRCLFLSSLFRSWPCIVQYKKRLTEGTMHCLLKNVYYRPFIIIFFCILYTADGPLSSVLGQNFVRQFSGRPIPPSLPLTPPPSSASFPPPHPLQYQSLKRGKLQRQTALLPNFPLLPALFLLFSSFLKWFFSLFPIFLQIQYLTIHQFEVSKI
jgi:hypothetical protein